MYENGGSCETIRKISQTFHQNDGQKFGEREGCSNANQIHQFNACFYPKEFSKENTHHHPHTKAPMEANSSARRRSKPLNVNRHLPVHFPAEQASVNEHSSVTPHLQRPAVHVSVLPMHWSSEVHNLVGS